MSLTRVSPGQPIRASHVTQFVDWLTAQRYDVSLAVTTTHATDYTATLINQHAGATGNILKLGYGTGTAVAATFGATQITFTAPTTFVGTMAFGSAPVVMTGLASTSAWALTVKNSYAVGTVAAGSFRVMTNSDYPILRVMRATNGNEFVSIDMSTEQLQPSVLTYISKNATGPTDATYITLETVMASYGTGGDHSAHSSIVDQRDSGGSNLLRAVEARARRLLPATAAGTWGHEVNVTTDVPHTAPSGNVGLYIQGGGGLGLTEAVCNSALFITGYASGATQAAVGWSHAMYYVDNDNTTRLFSVDRTGRTDSGHMFPRAHNTYSLGGPTANWISAYIAIIAAAVGSTGSPAYTFQGQTTDGLYTPGAGQVGVTLGGTGGAIFGATGLQLRQAISTLKATTASLATPASGYSALQAHTDESWYRTTSGGTHAQLMDASLIGRKNRVINGDFQVWQDGTSPSPNDNEYGPDQWRLLAETNTSATISRGSSAVITGAGHFNAVLTVGAGNNNKFGIFQPIEGSHIWDLRGTVCSLQAKLHVSHTRIGTVKLAVLAWSSTEDGTTGDPISAWGGDGTNPTLAANWAYANTPADATSGSITPTTASVLYTVQNIAVSATATNLGVFIWSDDKSQTAADTFTVSDVQLEPGAVSTSFERRPRSIEDDYCRRYYERISGSANIPFSAGGAISSTAFDSLVTLVAKRTVPTITTAGAYTTMAVYTAGGIVNLSTEPTILSSGITDRLFVRGTVAAGLVPGQFGLLYVNGTAPLIFSARL